MEIEVTAEIETTEIQVAVELENTVIGSGGSATVTNSNGSYSQTGSSPIVLPDETFEIYVNGVLNVTDTIPGMMTETIVIQP